MVQPVQDEPERGPATGGFREAPGKSRGDSSGAPNSCEISIK